jgi:hypothetical protein
MRATLPPPVPKYRTVPLSTVSAGPLAANAPSPGSAAGMESPGSPLRYRCCGRRGTRTHQPDRSRHSTASSRRGHPLAAVAGKKYYAVGTAGKAHNIPAITVRINKRMPRIVATFGSGREQAGANYHTRNESLRGLSRISIRRSQGDYPMLKHQARRRRKTDREGQHLISMELRQWKMPRKN